MSTETEELPPLLAPMTPAERQLLRAVLQWAIRAGWKRLPDSRKWGHYLSGDNRYSIIMSSTCLFVGRPGRSCTLVGSDRVGEMIAVLADLHVIPAHFSGLGRAALGDFATYCEQQAVQLALAADAPHEVLAGAAPGWFAAAAAARTFTRAA